MSEDPTVLVVGGGATGAGVARDLSLRGVDVTLVERGALAGGTSGRSHGVLHSGARYAESDPTGAEKCIEENRLIREIADECVRETGSLFVQLSDDDPSYFDQKLEACEAVGIEAEEIDPETARAAAPGLSPDVERVLRVPDAVMWPSRLVAANAADAEAHGASVHPDAPLEGFAVADGEIRAATVGGRADRTFDPEYVVNATGAWAGRVAGMAGAEAGMAPSCGIMISVEYDALGPVLNRCRPPDDGDIVVPHESEAVVGTTSVPVSGPDEYERADWEVERNIEECAAMLPAVAEVPVVRTWWGVRSLYARDEAGEGCRGISRGFTVVDHGDEGVGNLCSVVGGKLTTYRQMAEAVADHVCDHLGVNAACETATRELEAADDPDRLDELVAAYGSPNPTDADVVTAD